MTKRLASKTVWRMRSLSASLMLAAAVVAGCSIAGGPPWASYGPGPLKAGDTEAAVLTRMGLPSARVALAEGQRLVYSRGPFGRHTWLVDIGPDSRARSITQTLTPERFAAVKPGMSSQELLNWLGPTAEMRRLAIEDRRLWFWRFETNDCVWFAVTLDREGRVLDAGEAPDPLCEIKEPR